MRLQRTVTLALGLSLVASLVFAQQPDAPKAPAAEGVGPGAAAPAGQLKSFKERSSYVIGLDVGRGLKEQGVDLNLDVLMRGVTDGLAGAKNQMTDAEIDATLMELQKLVEGRRKEKNKKEGEAFLALNKKKEGVTELPSGLQYKVLKKGQGATPGATDQVTVHYRGTLIDGSEFDSSYRRGAPATFPVNKVIKGWTEAMQLMQVGDKWQLFVPADLAYGDKSPAEQIPPNATLIFEVELLDVQKGAAAPAPGAHP